MITRHIAILFAGFSIALFQAGCSESADVDQPRDPGPGEVLKSSLERDTSPSVSASVREQLSRDNRDFAFSLLQQLADDSGSDNIFFSPHSISIALAMTYAGASGATHEQMGEVLRFLLGEEDLHKAFNLLDLALDGRSEVELAPDASGDPPILNIVNAIWGQEDYPFADEFLDTLAVNYGAGMRVVDFVSDPEGVRRRINEWVEAETEERIEELLPEDSIKRDTVLVLTNAIYFFAGWDSPFPKGLTREGSFSRADGSTVTAELMEEPSAMSLLYYQGEETVAVAMPYVGREMSLVALMPTNPEDLSTWQASFDRARFDAVLGGLSYGMGRVVFPKFEFGGEYDLQDVFQRMGWTNFSDLRRMVSDGRGGLEITGIFHKSFIALDEEGTEAAAATAVVVGETAAPIEAFDLKFDRPFYYAIYDHPTDTILFLGRVFDPTVTD